MLFNVLFANNTLLACFFFIFLVIGLYLLIPAVVAKVFNPTAALAMPLGIPTKEPEAEMETHPVTGEAKISKCSR